MTTPDNPWLTIPAADYDGHMGHPSVAQRQMLDAFFAGTYRRLAPKTLAVPGCTTGRGLGALDWGKIEYAHAIDINPEYLDALTSGYLAHLDKLRAFCADLNDFEFPASYDWIHAALIFEYIDAGKFLSKAAAALNAGGTISVVLQLESKEHSAVSKTSFTSLERLSGIMKLTDPVKFKELCTNVSLCAAEERIATLHSGKQFYQALFTR